MCALPFAGQRLEHSFTELALPHVVCDIHNYTSASSTVSVCHYCSCCLRRCAREMHGIGKANWDAFVSPMVTDLYGHLLLYPIQVNPDGR